MQDQKNKTNSEQNNGKFNWTRLISWFLSISIVVIILLAIFGVFTPKKETKTQSEFRKIVNEYSSDLKDNKYFSKIKFDENSGEIYVETNSGDSYTVETANSAIRVFQNPKEDLNAAVFLASIQIKSSANSNDFFNLTPGADYYSKIKNSTYPKNQIQSIGKIENAKIPKASTASIFFDYFIRLLPLFVIFGLYYWMLKRSGGIGSILPGSGGSPAKKIRSNKSFLDVAGQAEAKEEVKEVVDFLKRPKKYISAGARIPKGILLGGPPGTGKTLIAKATAGEADVPFYFISASNFVEMFAGLGAKRVREMFNDARKNSPAILFIDELDAIGRRRGSSFSSNDEREQTLNQILVEMDGMKENESLLIIAATNRPDVLDPALLRPGRFDRTITVNLPDIKEREQILRLHSKGKRISKEINFKNIAKRTPRFSGAQLENIINEASLLSVRENTNFITLKQVDEAIDRVVAGPAKKHRIITEAENRMVAIHEAGHAVIGLKIADADIVQKITIIPRGQAGGYTLLTPKEEKYNYSRTQLLAKIITFLGGRAAEQVEYGIGEVSTGASDDIQKATQIARAMVTQYGMSALGPIAYESDRGTQFLGSDTRSIEYSEALAERIDEAIRKLIFDAEKIAIKTIQENETLLHLIADELIENETIVLEEIDFINKNLKRPIRKLDNIQQNESKSKSIDDLIKDTNDI